MDRMGGMGEGEGGGGEGGEGGWVEVGPLAPLSQLATPAWDGDGAQNAANDCGPTCAAVVLRHITGVWVWPDWIDDQLYGAGYRGYTDIGDLAGWLRGNGVDAVALGMDVVEAAEMFLPLGFPVIGRFRWGETGAHFRIVFGVSGEAVRLWDPWGAVVVEWSHEVARGEYLGPALVARRARGADVFLPEGVGA